MKKALVLFGNETSTENLIQSSIYLKEKFNYSLSGLFLSDIREGIVISPRVDGMVNDPTALYAGEWVHFEQQEAKKVLEIAKKTGLNIDIAHEIGLTGEIIKEYMKSFDLLIMGKGAYTSDLLISILKYNYKSVFFVGEGKLDFSKVFIANDDGVKVNKSIYNFTNVFPEVKDFVSVKVKPKTSKDNILDEYLQSKNKKITSLEVDNKEKLVEYFSSVDANSVMVMGNLSRSYFFEKLEKRTGLKLLEQGKASIFIG